MTESASEGFFEKLERVRLDFASLVRELSDTPFAVPATEAKGGWSGPLGEWWSRERAEADQEVAALYEKLVEHGRILFKLAEQLDAPRPNDRDNDNTDLMVLLEAFQRSLGECLQSAAAHGGDMFSPMSHLVDAWRQHAAAVFGIPGNLAGEFPERFTSQDAEGLAFAARGWFDPAGVAASRLHGEQLTALAQALVDYQDTFNRFVRLAIETTGDTLSRMEAELGGHTGGEARGVREFYALWLRCCEDAYDELVREERFANLMGELVNAAVRVHAARQRLADSAAQAMGLPTRRDVRELSASLHETRRRLARLERGRTAPAKGNPLAERRHSMASNSATSATDGQAADAGRIPAPPAKPSAAAGKKSPRGKKATTVSRAGKKTAKKAAARANAKADAGRGATKKAPAKKVPTKHSASKKTPARKTTAGKKAATGKAPRSGKGR